MLVQKIMLGFLSNEYHMVAGKNYWGKEIPDVTKETQWEAKAKFSSS